MKISKEFLEKSRKNFSSDRGNLIAQRASVNNGIMKAAFNRFEDDTNRHTFNIELKEKDIRNQKRSGRCWMFAALNVMEYELCKKYNLKSFELSKKLHFFMTNSKDVIISLNP